MEKNEQRNLKDWNQLLAFLAAPDEKDFEKLSAPTLILAGNGLPILADKAAQMYVNGQVERLFLVGGVGHATRILYENFEKQGFHFEEGMSESEICRQYLKEVYDLPDKAFLIESKSTNSGENATFSLEILHSLDAVPEKVLLMNDPTLQRRTRATFEKVWQNEQTVFVNAVPFVPEILHFSEEIIFAGITAYDNQSIRNIYVQTNGTAHSGIAVFMALKLYLDFINLFLAFLRIFGRNN